MKAAGHLFALTIALGAAPGAIALPASAVAAPALVGPDPTTDALVGQLRRALVERRDGGQDRLMAALRQLRDPGLRPLFAQLASGDRPILRIHGILGLAELDTPPRVDLLLVKRIEDPREQLVILGEALRAGLLEPAQLQDVVRWPGLDETLVVLILGKLRRTEGAPPVDLADLRRVLTSQNQAAAVFASMELVQAGEPTGAAPTAASASPTDEPPPPTPLDRVLALNPNTPDDAAAIARVFGYIREERLTSLLPVAMRLWAKLDAGDDAGAKADAAGTLIGLAPADGDTVKAWTQTYHTADLAGRIRLGLEALEVARQRTSGCAEAIFAPMEADDAPLLRAMGAVGPALIRGDGVAIAAEGLVAQQHRPTLEWAVHLAKSIPEGQARNLRLAVIRHAGAALREQPGLFDPVARAAAGLAADSPGVWRSVLLGTLDRGEEPLAVALLAGALQSGAIVDPQSLIPPAQAADLPIAASLADLLRFRAQPEPTAADFDRLASIAMGSGGLPEAYRVQAAWLALKCRGEQRVALARVLAEGP